MGLGDKRTRGDIPGGMGDNLEPVDLGEGEKNRKETWLYLVREEAMKKRCVSWSKRYPIYGVLHFKE